MRDRNRKGLLVAVSWAFVWLAAAGSGLLASERAVLIVNADSPSSKLVANHYLALRRLPAVNVIYLSGVPDQELVTLQEFRKTILTPIFQQLQQRKLLGRIDYILYSADFPTAVQVGPDLRKLEQDFKEKTGKPLDRRPFNPTASINALTYYAEAVLAEEPAYLLLDANHYFRGPASELLRKPFLGPLQAEFAMLTEQIKTADSEALADVAARLEAIAQAHPQQLAVTYTLARCYGRLGESEKTAQWLTRSVQLGWAFRRQSQADRSFEAVAMDPQVREIIERMEDEPFDLVPTQRFRSRYRWGPNGMVNGTATQGNRHYLSTVLAVTRGQGISEREAVEFLQKTARADASRPTGTFYFTETDDVRTTTRSDEFPAAVAALQRMGHGAEIVQQTLPAQRRDVAGLTSGAANVPWVQSGSRFLPGAIADNFTSFGGRMAVKGQTKATEFLKQGAAGASGTVIEPYAIAAKFPHPQIHVHYARGCTLAEAFYQSVAGPWQLLIVGDGLCQPFVEPPPVTVDLLPGSKLKDNVALKLNSESEDAKLATVEFWIDGRPVHQQVGLADWTLATGGLADGFHQLRVVVMGAGRFQPEGRILIPFEVDNRGHQVTLAAEHEEYLDTDTLRLTATSNVGQEILLVHNGRLIDRQQGSEVSFEVAAALLGRGPVQLEAVATGTSSEDGSARSIQAVASQPLSLRIQGRLNERPRRLEER